MYRAVAIDSNFITPLVQPTAVFASFNTQVAIQSTFSFPSQDIGDSSQSRLVVVAVSGNNGEVVSGTIGGIPTVTHTSTATGSGASLSIISAAVPTSTSATIDLIYDFSDVRCLIGVWALYGLNSYLPYDSATNRTSEHNANFLTLSGLTIPAQGIGILSYATDIYFGPYGWSMGTKCFDNPDGSSAEGATGAIITTNYDITPDVTVTNNSTEPIDRIIGGVSWR